MLTSVESFWLQWHAQRGEAETAATARAWLAAVAGPPNADPPPPADEAALARFRQRGLTQFPTPTLQALLDTTAHADQHLSGVADTAQRLFDVTRPLHHLRLGARRRLVYAARLHHLTGPGAPDSAAALEAVPLPDLSRRDQAAVVAVLRAAERRSHAARKSTAVAPDPESSVLAALLQLADALDYDQDQATRLLSVALTPLTPAGEPGGAAALVLRVSGLGAPATARRVRLCRRGLKSALNIGLRVTVAPPSLEELRPLLSEPLSPQATVAQAVQRGVAEALLAWQAALEQALTGDDRTLTLAERHTAHLRQVLGVFRPVLKRKATHTLRARLGELQRRLRAASGGRATTADALAYAAALPSDQTTQMQPLLEALDQAGRKAFAEAEAWLNSAQAAELVDDLLALVGAVPLRHGPDVTLRASAPALLAEVTQAISERRKEFEPSDSRSQRRLCEGLVRGQATLVVIGGAVTLGPGAVALAADWHTLEQRIEGLRHLAALDEAVGVFLDEWALRQARRKAPQLSGVDAVLAYRHRRRTERQSQRRALAADWRPVQGRALTVRVKQLLAGLTAAG